MRPHLAIDFGTSNSLVVLVTDRNSVTPLAIDPGNEDPTILRSVLYSPSRDEWEFGQQAIESYYHGGAEGRIFRSLKKFLPDPLFTGTQVHGVYHSLEELMGRMLRTMRMRAEAVAGEGVKSVVLGHPALFSRQPQLHQQALQRLEKAARLAGFTDIDFCPEPIAAAHEFATSLETARTVLIADFGGGTSDFTVVKLRPEGFQPEDVLALDGLSIAGDAFDGSIMEHSVAPYFGSKVEYRVPFGSNVQRLPKALVRKMCSPADLLLLGRQDYLEFFQKLDDWSVGENDAQSLERLRLLVEDRQGYALFQSIEEGKKNLSSHEQATIAYQYPGIDLHVPLLRGEFNDYSAPLVEAIVECMDRTILQSGLTPDQIDLVCCTGGTARLKAVQGAMIARFGEDRLQQHLPFHAVVQGLAHYAARKNRS